MHTDCAIDDNNEFTRYKGIHVSKHIHLGGCHTVESLLNNAPERIEKLFITKDLTTRLSKLISLAQAKGIGVEKCTNDSLDQKLPQVSHQGVIIACKPIRQQHLESFLTTYEPSSSSTLLILDQLQDPQNLGACIRLAAAFCVDAIITPSRNAAKMSASVAKVASGADAIVPVIEVVNISRAIQLIQQSGIGVYATSEKAGESIMNADTNRPIAWVVGNEAKGVRQHVLQSCDSAYYIPTSEVFPTLNAAMSAGICLYETSSQRRRINNQG